MIKWMTLISLLIGIHTAHAEIRLEPVAYKDGAVALEGYVGYDTKKISSKHPGILVVHDWMGMGPNVKARVKQLAELGYVAFAADIYGKDGQPADAKAAGSAAGKYKADRALYRRRLNLALEQLKKQKGVDDAQIAAIGYCFGGTGALELGRAGADIKGIVTFHGGLDTPTPADAKNIKGKVLVLHGADDPFVNAAQVQAFEDEMRTAGVDWELVKYSKSVHSFTIPDAGNDNSKGAAYNPESDKRSWLAMQNFFKEIFH